jgi:hypothetical protein
LLPLFAVFEARAQQKESAKDKLDYRELVKGLVSPNKLIEVYDEDSLRFPRNYDSVAQERIEKNRRVLYKHCAEALPFLIEASTDARYALTWKSDSYAESMCVGEVCLEIVRSHLELYRAYMPSTWRKDRSFEYSFVPRIGGTGKQVTEEEKKIVQQWWQERKGKTLIELQVEAFDWSIKKRSREEGGKEEVDRLIAIRDKLKKERKCLAPRSIPPSVLGERRVSD